MERTNAARRLIKSYFRKTQQFCSRGFLAPEDLRGHLTMAQRLEMLFEVIEPFERARKQTTSGRCSTFTTIYIEVSSSVPGANLGREHSRGSVRAIFLWRESRFVTKFDPSEFSFSPS